MMESNIRKYAKAGLDYLVKDYQNTVSDVKSIEKHARKAAIPVVLTGVGFVSGIIGCGGGGGSSGSSAPAPTLEFRANAIDGLSKNYAKSSDLTDAYVIYTDLNGQPPAGINAIAKNESTSATTGFQMFPDTSVITPTLKDGDYKNGEAYKAAIELPITGTYLVKFDASNGSAVTSTGWCSHLSILPDNAKSALDTRLGLTDIYPRSAGMSATAVAPAVGEADELLYWIANANDSDIVAKKFRDELYRLDPTGAILNDGTLRSMTREEYDLLLRFKFNTWINRRLETQTETLAPVLNAYIADEEIPDKFYSFDLDKINSKFWITAENSNQIQRDLTWTLDSEALNNFNKAFDTNLADTYQNNYENGYITFDGQGYQIIW